MWRRVLVLWCASRVVIIGLGVFLTSQLGWHRTLASWQHQPWVALTGWDSAYYIKIAHHGYSAGRTVAFFPLYPMLIHVVDAGGVLGNAGAALLVSNLACLAALWGMFVLGRDRLGQERAWRGVLYLVLSPYGFALALAYSEGVFLALAVWLFVCSDRRKDWLAIPLGICAGLARVNGLALIFPLALVAWRRRTWGSALAAVAPAVGVALYAGWLQHVVGDPLAFVHAQSRWGGHPSFPPFALGDEIYQFVMTGRLTHLISAVTVITYLALLIPIFRRRIFAGHRWEDVTYVAGIFALPLLAGVLQSSGRFGLLAFPVFFALADIGIRKPTIHRAFIVFAPVVQVIAFAYVALGYLVP